MSAAGRARAWRLLVILAMLAVQAAQADRFPAMGPTLAETGSAHYRFVTHDLISADGKRHYRIWIGTPGTGAPATGYPVIYMLDGNAVMADLREEWLAPRPDTDSPMIVAIGYATQQRFDVVARAFDYTPPVSPGESDVDPLSPERRNGGADALLDLIEQKVKPLAMAIGGDPNRQTLWGHSYGGLLVLHALRTRPASFQAYIAVDPSLWWRKGALLRDLLTSHPETKPRQVALLIATGTDDRAAANSAQVQLRRAIQASVPADSPQRLRDHLSKQPGITACYHEYPDLTHGPLLTAAIAPALRMAETPQAFIDECD